MDKYFSIHNRYSIAIRNIPKHLIDFIQREFGYFETERKSHVNLSVDFVSDLSIPNNVQQLSEKLSFAEGNVYFTVLSSTVCYPIKDFPTDEISVCAESDLEPWFLLYIIEKTLQMKIIEKDCFFLHAAGIVLKDKAFINTSMKSVGKTGWILENSFTDAEFLGDDLILCDGSGRAYSYPRGVNLHYFHGDPYKKILRRLKVNISLSEKLKIKIILGVLKFPFLNTSFRKKCETSLKNNSLIRLSINDIFPNAKIARSANVNCLRVSIDDNNSRFNAPHKSESAVSRFLQRNISIERGSHVWSELRKLSTCNSEDVGRFFRHINHLLKMELSLIKRFMRHVNIEVNRG